jgi:energy-converting hydrogenase Eha subunit C
VNVASDTKQVYLYFAPLTVLLYLVLPDNWLLDITTSFMMKNQLHASASEVASFRLLTAIPVYLAFLFGFTRDLWSPFGQRDRGYFLLFAPLSAGALLWMAYSPLSYGRLFAGMLLVMVSFRFVSAAYQGLLALVGQEQLMSGRLSALWNTFSWLPAVFGAYASGYLTENLQPRQTFTLVAALSLAIGLLGLTKPRAVFDHTYDRPQALGASFIQDIRRLGRHKPIYPAVVIMFLYQFAPGASTPLQFYLSEKLHAPDAIYSDHLAIFLASNIPMFLLYGYLCKKVPLSKLLWWGTFITIPQAIPYALIHTPTQALIAAVPIGLMGGIAQAAYSDLAMRSCPPGLQGTLMMLVAGVWVLSFRASDLLGSWIYSADPIHGFLYCVLTTIAVYSLIVPMLFLIPKGLVATADGEAPVSA